MLNIIFKHNSLFSISGTSTLFDLEANAFFFPISFLIKESIEPTLGSIFKKIRLVSINAIKWKQAILL